MQRLYVDGKECTGCEYCVNHLPEVFLMGAEGMSHVRGTITKLAKDIVTVIENCPAECIHWK